MLLARFVGLPCFREDQGLPRLYGHLYSTRGGHRIDRLFSQLLAWHSYQADRVSRARAPRSRLPAIRFRSAFFFSNARYTPATPPEGSHHLARRAGEDARDPPEALSTQPLHQVRAQHALFLVRQVDVLINNGDFFRARARRLQCQVAPSHAYVDKRVHFGLGCRRQPLRLMSALRNCSKGIACILRSILKSSIPMQTRRREVSPAISRRPEGSPPALPGLPRSSPLGRGPSPE